MASTRSRLFEVRAPRPGAARIDGIARLVVFPVRGPQTSTATSSQPGVQQLAGRDRPRDRQPQAARPRAAAAVRGRVPCGQAGDGRARRPSTLRRAIHMTPPPATAPPPDAGDRRRQDDGEDAGDRDGQRPARRDGAVRDDRSRARPGSPAAAHGRRGAARPGARRRTRRRPTPHSTADRRSTAGRPQDRRAARPRVARCCSPAPQSASTPPTVGAWRPRSRPSVGFGGWPRSRNTSPRDASLSAPNACCSVGLANSAAGVSGCARARACWCRAGPVLRR